MKRTEYVCHEYVSFDDLEAIENSMSLDEIQEMKTKMKNVVGNMAFHDIKDRALSERAFKQGYLAAHATLERKSGAV